MRWIIHSNSDPNQKQHHGHCKRQRKGGERSSQENRRKFCNFRERPLDDARSIANPSAAGWWSSLWGQQRELGFDDEAQELHASAPLPLLNPSPSGRCFRSLLPPGGQQEQQESNITLFPDIKRGGCCHLWALSHRWQEPNPRRTPVGLSSVYCLSKGMWWWCCADFDVQLCAAAAAKAWCTVTLRPAAAGLKRATTTVCSLKNGTLIKNINENKKKIYILGWIFVFVRSFWTAVLF